MCNSISTFVKNNQTLCILTGGLSIIGYLAWRLVVWLKDLCGTAKKTDHVFRETLDKPVTIQKEAGIQISLPVSKIESSPLPSKDPWPRMALITLDIAAGFLALREFAVLRTVCTKSARLNAFDYFKKNLHYEERVIHHKSDFRSPDYWQTAVLKAAPFVREFTFKHPTAVAGFPAIQSHFSTLNQLTFKSGSKISSRTLPPLLTSTITSLDLSDAIEGFGHLVSIFNHMPLEKLTIRNPDPWWWATADGANRVESPCPSLRVLKISSATISALSQISGIGKFSLLEHLSLEMEGVRGIRRQICQTVAELAPKLTNLKFLSFQKRGRWFSANEIGLMAAFRTPQTLFVGTIKLEAATVSSLAQLAHIKCLGLGLELGEIENEAALQEELQLIDRLTLLSNLTELKIHSVHRPSEDESNALVERYDSRPWDKIRIKKLLEVLGPKIIEILYTGSELTDREVLEHQPNLENCQSLSIYEATCECSSLKTLLRGMPKLRSLTIDDSHIDPSKDRSLDPTSSAALEFMSLNKCTLRRSMISQEAITELASWRIPSLEYLELIGVTTTLAKENCLTDTDLIKLLKRKTFQRLTLMRGAFTDKSWLYLSENHKGLRVLFLSGDNNKITDLGVQALSSLPLLEQLTLPRGPLKNSETPTVLKQRGMLTFMSH